MAPVAAAALGLASGASDARVRCPHSWRAHHTPSLPCPPRRTAEARDTGGLQQLLGMLGAEGFALPFPPEDVPQRLADCTVIEREGKVGGLVGAGEGGGLSGG